jgi:signal transduction histidine kinase
MQSDWRPRRAVPRFTAYALCVLAVSAATWLELLIAGSSVRALSLTPFGVCVALSVWLGGLGPGLLALILSTISIDYFIIGPHALFEFQAPANAFVLTAYLASWVAFIAIAERVSRRHALDRQSLRTAEDAALQSSRVAQLTTALSRARTQSAAIEAALQEPLHALRADAGALLIVGRDGRGLETARAVGYPSSGRLAPSAGVLRARNPASDAVGRGAPVILESAAAYGAEYRVSPSGGGPSAPGALIAVPLLVGSRVVAVVQLEFRAPRVFSKDDREYIDVLGPRAAQALDRTLEYESALQARADAEALRERADQELSERQKIERALRASETRYRTLAARTSRLHGLAAALSESVTLQAVARAVVQHGRNVLGAASGDVLLLADGGFAVLYSDVPRDSAYTARIPLEPGLCATDVVERREPVFVASFDEWQERYSRSAAIAADGGYVSSATLPLLVDGAPIGVLAFHFTAPVNFDDEYRALLRSVEQHCSQALDRARLYETAQQARADAETANRLKDEFVSVVSHDLRTPLNAILGWTSMLQDGSIDPSMSKRALQTIHDNATRQLRLVEDLLDLSRLQSGRMALNIEDVDLRGLLRGVIESIVPVAAGGNLQLDIETIPSLKLRGDTRRLEQVFFNLLGNAVKFTPEGGRVALGVRDLNGAVEIRVTDTGEGIDPEFLPHVFDAFRQADGDTARRHGGAGLGLSIARELIEAHKGSITAESSGVGRGASFIVRLPTAGPGMTAVAGATIH